MADQKDTIENPGISQATISSKIAFITSVNKPNVIMFMGNVSILSTGFIIIFRIPKIKAAIRASTKLLTDIPEMI